MNTSKNNIAPEATTQDFPIVGVGASAGGLKAFKEFLSAITVDSGMAYVLVQHLYPSHESILPEILSRFTNLPVLEITDDIHLAPNHVYVIPENKILTSTDGVLKLSARDKHRNRTIDIFFTTLAEVHLELAVGVILSGTGSDGTVGLKAIKDHGGMTCAQNEESAEYFEMPAAAIRANVIDFILPSDAMPQKLLEVYHSGKLSKEESLDKADESVFTEIISLLREQSGVDFTYYKQTTVRRRIARRMAMTEMSNLKDYLKFLQGDKSATKLLFNDLLIPVTSFFRDPKIFCNMRETVFPLLLEKKPSSNSIRVWVAGCSTGQEAYSFAMTLHDFLSENSGGIQIKIFASDVSEISITKARIGIYNDSELEGIPEKFLKKYFTKKKLGYQINGQIRDLCVFAVHNFLKDPPFAKMDIVSCRNVLIYLDPFLQKKAITTFHYSLSPEGFLMLGKSETVSQVKELFSALAKSGKIFRRKEVSGRFVHQAMSGREDFSAISITKKSRKETLKTDFIRSAEVLLLSSYTPASVVVNGDLDIVHVNGLIAAFLEFPQGKPTFNLLRAARQGLGFELRNAMHKVKERIGVFTKEGIPVKIDGKVQKITLEIRPLTDTVEPYFLVLFYKTHLKAAITSDTGAIDSEINQTFNLKRIRTLENELAQTHSDVNAITAEQESFNEELQSANEELLSGSEELQSLNEELETSKEELQSSNEELIIINEELLSKQDQLNEAKNYTEAIVDTLREPIVVLDSHLRIKKINRAFSKKYSISTTEAQGKLIYEIHNRLFDIAMLRSMLEQILLQKKEIDDFQISVNFQPYEESTMLLNARQVTNEKSKEQLILLAIEDITERKNIESQQRTFAEDLETKVTQRTAELEISLKNLSQANIRLQQFAYIASHDLQEPLRKILIFTSILQEQEIDLPEHVVLILNKISRSSDRMKTLIENLLAYSYVSSDDGLFVDTDLNTVVNNILTDFELLIEQKKISVSCATLPVIHAIPLQMNQLFYNIISNALKFARTKRPFLEINCKYLSGKDLKNYPTLHSNVSWCEITFTDNGIGFDQKYERQIFTIFQRLHSNDAYTGTGIGLAISQKIIDNHKGIIFAKSVKGEGTVFHVILPINKLKKEKIS